MNSPGLIKQIGRFVILGMAAAVAVLASSSPAAARQWGRPATNRPPSIWPRPNPTPEVDPGALRGALTLIAGGLLVLSDRRRRR